MTRINCIPASELVNKHLLAEYRELPRIFTAVNKYVAAGDMSFMERIPDTYRMGAGHVMFFYDKLLWLVERYNDLIDELESRGYDLNEQMINDILQAAQELPSLVMGKWSPDAAAMDINRQRIRERLEG